MTPQRLTDRLVQYWELIKKDKQYPDYAAISTAGISDIWSSCITVKIQPTAAGALPRFQFVLVGEAARTIFGKDPTGEYFTASAKTFPAARILSKMATALASPAPLYDEGQFVNEKNKIVKFRSVLVPFGKDDGQITHLVVGLSWREF